MNLVPRGVLGVAVFHAPSPELLRETAKEVSPDLFQAELTALAGVPSDRILPVVVDGDDLDAAMERALDATSRGMVLVDSAAKGGTGTVSDWERLAGVTLRDRMILAGGLHPEDVGRAVATVNPFGVDVSSGIESAPGVKDPDLMREFVKAARAAEAALKGEMAR
jgi:phosphoribosylanthranilate isomerase